MKKVILLMLLAPVGLIAQDITNTLGSGGKFIVEDNSNNDVLLINPANIISEFVFGLQPVGFNPGTNLPTGQYTFLSGALLPAAVNLLSASNSASNGSFLELIRERGSLNTPLILVAGDRLGTINFGAYSNPSWSTSLTSISSTIGTVTGTAPAAYSTNFIFETTAPGGGKNRITFDDAGNLTVPGAMTSQAYRSTSISTTATLNDQVIGIISTNGLNIAVTLPAASSAIVGKTYTIKKTGPENYQIQINGNGANIEGGANVTFGSNNTLDHVTVVCTGSEWFVIAEGSGL